MPLLNSNGAPIDDNGGGEIDPETIEVPYRMPSGEVIQARPRKLIGADVGFLLVFVRDEHDQREIAVHVLDESDMGIALATHPDTGVDWPILLAAAPPNTDDGRMAIMGAVHVVDGICDMIRSLGIALPDGYPGKMPNPTVDDAGD